MNRVNIHSKNFWFGVSALILIPIIAIVYITFFGKQGIYYVDSSVILLYVVVINPILVAIAAHFFTKNKKQVGDPSSFFKKEIAQKGGKADMMFKIFTRAVGVCVILFVVWAIVDLFNTISKIPHW